MPYMQLLNRPSLPTRAVKLDLEPPNQPRKNNSRLGSGKALSYCSGAEWAPLQDHLLRAVVDPLRSLDMSYSFRS
jgi:hypothetical protein